MKWTPVSRELPDWLDFARDNDQTIIINADEIAKIQGLNNKQEPISGIADEIDSDI